MDDRSTTQTRFAIAALSASTLGLLFEQLVGWRAIGAAVATIPSEFYAPIAIVASAVGASTFALLNIRAGRATAKLQEALRMINGAELDREFVKAKNIWARYRRTKEHEKSFAAIAWVMHHDAAKDSVGSTTTDQDVQDRATQAQLVRDAQYIMLFLNYFELSCLAIERNIIDDTFFRLWQGRYAIRVFDYSASFIFAMRRLQENETMYCHLERAAERWAEVFNISDRRLTTSDFTREKLAEFGRDSMILRELGAIAQSIDEQRF